MNYNFDDYLNVVKLNIKNKKLHAPICTELESHLQDSADFYVEIGYDEATANEKALADMGEPAVVGESMAKLHELSGGQKFLQTSFIILVILKILDVIAFNVFNGWPYTFLIDDFFNFVCVGEFVSMLATVFAGFALSMRLKRITPAIFAVIIPIFDIESAKVFGLTSWLAITGRIEECLGFIGQGYADNIGTVDNIISYLWMFLILMFIIFAFVSIARIISKPFSDCRRLKKILNTSMLIIMSVSFVIFGGLYCYIDARDKAQFEVYSRVVSDMCDLCLENGKLTADDYDMVVKKFDYLDFEELDDFYVVDGETGVSASIGKQTIMGSSLHIMKKDDGSLFIKNSVSRSYNELDFSLGYFSAIKVWAYNNRWEGSDEAIDFMMKFSDEAQPGDSLEGYLNMVKETSSDFSYAFDAKTGKETYTTELEMSGLFGQWYYYISADDGKFVSIKDMID